MSRGLVLPEGGSVSMSFRDPVSAMAVAVQAKAVVSEPAVHARKATNMKTMPSTAIRPVLVQSHAMPLGSTEEGVEGSFSRLTEIGRVVDCPSAVAIAEGVVDVVSCASAGAAWVEWSRLSPGVAVVEVRDSRGPLCPAFSS